MSSHERIMLMVLLEYQSLDVVVVHINKIDEMAQNLSKEFNY